METPLSHCKSTGNFLDLNGSQLRSQWSIWPEFELVRDFMHILNTGKYKKDWIKNNRE